MEKFPPKCAISSKIDIGNSFYKPKWTRNVEIYTNVPKCWPKISIGNSPEDREIVEKFPEGERPRGNFDNFHVRGQFPRKFWTHIFAHLCILSQHFVSILDCKKNFQCRFVMILHILAEISTTMHESCIHSDRDKRKYPA